MADQGNRFCYCRTYSVSGNRFKSPVVLRMIDLGRDERDGLKPQQPAKPILIHKFYHPSTRSS